MAVYKTTFCKIGYNSEITTSTDPEDVCTGLGLNGSGVYKFPVKIPSTLISTSIYTRTYFISSSSVLDTSYHHLADSAAYSEEDTILIDENQHGSVGAMEVKVSGLNTNFGLIEEIVQLNGQTPVKLANHYHRINEMKVVTVGRQLSNQGDIYLSALDGVRTSYLLNLNDFVSSGVPISTQKIYAKIPGSDNRMLSSHYTVPRSHTLYIESLRILTDVATICNWILMAGVNGSLHTILKSRSSSSFPAQEIPLTFKRPYVFPAGSDIKIKINTVGGTTDVTSIMEGYLISQVQLEWENVGRKKLQDQIIANPNLASTISNISREEELVKEGYQEDEYTDEEFSDIPDYSDVESEQTYDDPIESDVPPGDEDSYEEECEDGYTWCDSLGDCLDADTECP